MKNAADVIDGDSSGKYAEVVTKGGGREMNRIDVFPYPPYYPEPGSEEENDPSLDNPELCPPYYPEPDPEEVPYPIIYR